MRVFLYLLTALCLLGALGLGIQHVWWGVALAILLAVDGSDTSDA